MRSCSITQNVAHGKQMLKNADVMRCTMYMRVVPKENSTSLCTVRKEITDSSHYEGKENRTAVIS